MLIYKFFFFLSVSLACFFSFFFFFFFDVCVMCTHVVSVVGVFVVCPHTCCVEVVLLKIGDMLRGILYTMCAES